MPPRSKSNDASGGDAPEAMHNLARLMAMLQNDAGVRNNAPREHRFWKTQPVVQDGESTEEAQGPIHPPLPPDRVRAEAYPLPADFEWVTVDIESDAQLKEVYDLLSANYVEDDDSTLRFDYSPEFLQWSLRHPGYTSKWHVGVRVVSTGKLVAFIAGIPLEMRVRDQVFRSTEINFLCVHKKLRSKRLAPVLIKEVTRRCHLEGVFQAIYTVGSVLPTPVSCARYYHRTINAEKLLDIGFSAVPHGMSRAEHIRRFTLPDETATPGLREMTDDDVPQVSRLFRRYMARFEMSARYTDEEVRHLLLSGRGRDEGGKRVGQVTWTYVVADEAGVIHDFVSFYSLPSSVLNNPKHSKLNAAYLFYYATDAAFEEPLPKSDASGPSQLAQAKAEGVPAWQCSEMSALTPAEAADEDVAPWNTESAELRERLKERLNALMRDTLVIAKQHGFDVVNCLTVMDNALFVYEQKFGPGDGFLRFYLFNWRVAPIPGGMGARTGEAELDPAAKVTRTPVSLFGSGNGIVMV
ncbi:glycylpeptide N-tetradecanoyltransferase [Malassezia cuniculi]|uniref:Glycylpeptide N-tetradecanoyltransferase n=1 Tax=Malassezia cuniculi TaxID=948313 RepID=A0AAF0J5Q0_9BASI|nr:glycylpeptide N-tetradecanoyltransferase [Malassezia cuniculi]